MDISFAERFLSGTVPQVVFNFLTGVTIFIILMVKCDKFLTLLGLAAAIASSLLVVWLNRILAGYAEAQRRSYSDINRIFDETVQGIDTLKIFSGEERQTQKFEQENDRFRKLSVSAGRIAAIFSPVIGAITQYGNLLILMLIYNMLTKGSLSRDSFLLFFFYLTMFQSSFNNIISQLSNIQPTLVSLGRLNELFMERSEPGSQSILSSPDDSLQISPPSPGGASLILENLTFGYAPGRNVFQNASLQIEPNQSVLISGRSGSGKTTLINLLMRFYEPNGGRILINSLDIGGMPVSAVRNMISVVTQDYFIFEDTLRENIKMANPQASDSDIMEALEKANLTRWFQNLPDGLDTIPGSRGRTLSGGERQRICIARAFLKKAPLTILDEPFANIDREAQLEIARAIGNLKKESTILIISHQPMSDEVINRVLFLNNGGIG
jgi:ABC-type multidrug transport system fused ATPase/permease subunit